MIISKWRAHAATAIWDCILTGRRDGHGVDQIIAKIDESYPFCERVMHRDRIWLDERRKFINMLRRLGGDGR